MDNIASERFRVFLAQRPGTSSLYLAVAAGDTAPEDVVLPSGVYANDSSHLVIVWPDRHPRTPNDVENCKIVRMIELLNFCAPRLAQSLENTRRIRHGAGDNFTHRFVRLVLGHSTTTVSYELIDVEHDIDLYSQANGEG